MESGVHVLVFSLFILVEVISDSMFDRCLGYPAFFSDKWKQYFKTKIAFFYEQSNLLCVK